MKNHKRLNSLTCTLGFYLNGRMAKRRFYGSYLDATADIAFNPAGTPTGGKVSKTAAEIVRRLLPVRLWPEHIRNIGEWAEIKGPLSKQASLRNRMAVRTLSDALFSDLSDVQDERTLSIITTTVYALERCSGAQTTTADHSTQLSI